MFQNLTQDPTASGSTRGPFGDIAQGVGSLADIWGAWEASRQTKDMSGNLKQLYTDALARRQPFVDRLGQSYTDPNTFFNSNQWQGLKDVYQNSIDRKAAAAGRLANPTDREVLLQNYAMKELENYRQGLRGAADTLSPNFALSPMVAGIGAESRANNPWGALIGEQRTPTRGGVGSQIGGSIDAIAKIFGGVEKIPDYLRQALGLGGSIPGMDFGNVFGGMENLPNVLGGGFGDLPGGGESIIDGFDFDTSWLEDFGDWF